MVRTGFTDHWSGDYHRLLTKHLGFAVVGEYEDNTIKEAQAQAFEQMLKWIKDH